MSPVFTLAGFRKPCVQVGATLAQSNRHLELFSFQLSHRQHDLDSQELVLSEKNGPVSEKFQGIFECLVRPLEC